MRQPPANSRLEAWQLKHPDADSAESAAGGPAPTPVCAPEPGRADSGAALRRLKIGLILIWLAGMAGLGAWSVRNALDEREAAIRAGRSRAAELALAAAEQSARTFGEADAVLALLAEAQRRNAASAEPDPESLPRALSAQLAERPQIAAIALLDAAGRILLFGTKAGVAIQAGEWKSAPAAAAGAARATLGRAVADPASGRWTIPLLRSLDAGDAPLRLAAMLAPSYFEAALRTLALPEGGEILLLHAEGRVLARHPAGPPDAPANALPPFRAEFSNLRTVSFRETLPGAPGERIGAFSRLADYPAIVFVSMPEETVLAPWREAALVRAGGFVMIALLVGLILFALQLAARRRAEAAAAARAAAEAAEERLRGRGTALEQLDAQLAAFSYAMSHDLRTPLRAINGFAQALQEECGQALDEQRRVYLARIRDAAQRMGETIDRLVELTGLSRSGVRRTEIDLSEMAHSIAAELSRRDPQRVASFAIAPGLHASADRRLVRVLLTQLMDNAWKFSRERPQTRISVGALAAGGERVFFIDDNGIGFDMAHAARLFEPFQRLHPGAGFEGAGIGLAMVKRIVELHGGRVWADAVPDQGLTLFFTLCPPPQQGAPGPHS
ncbi:MAG: hypothetical protein Fur0039_22550 [Rhodocyclaceae bacterium]